MKITILAYGSRGDVKPFLALALGLQKAGHSLRLAAPHRFNELAAQHGVPFVPLPGDPEEISLRLNDARGNLYKMVKSMKDYIFAIAEPVLRAALDACDGADLIVHSFLFTSGGHALAQARGIPDVSVQGFPMFAPTRAFPNVAMPNVPRGTLSYFTHWLATQIYWHGGNRYRLPDDIHLDPKYRPAACRRPDVLGQARGGDWGRTGAHRFKETYRRKASVRPHPGG